MNTKTIATIVVLLIIAAGATFLLSNKGGAPTPVPDISSSTPASTASSTPKEVVRTMAEIATHNSAVSCWTAVNGKAYDVTSWIDQHPGGRDAILSLCGKDGSAAFNGQHGSQARPNEELKSFYIGVVYE